jgi:hypothetical protein
MSGIGSCVMRPDDASGDEKHDDTKSGHHRTCLPPNLHVAHVSSRTRRTDPIMPLSALVLICKVVPE